jgi:hypothetical protein
LPPEEPAVTAASVKAADARYLQFAGVGRCTFLKQINRASGPPFKVMTILSETARDGARGFSPRINLAMKTDNTVNFGTERRFTSVIQQAIQNSLLDGSEVSFIWIPIRLSPANVSTPCHSNSLFINLTDKRVYLFEPHGNNPSDEGNSRAGFHDYYNGQDYQEQFRLRLAKIPELTGFSYFMPSDYQPALFGQSCSLVNKLGADSWCTLWGTLFFVFATRKSPEYFVKLIMDLTKANELKSWIINVAQKAYRWDESILDASTSLPTFFLYLDAEVLLLVYFYTSVHHHVIILLLFLVCLFD